jgi:hypothetical protein
MKKTILLISAALLISVSSNCQWYQRKYEVNDINLLSKDQLNTAASNSKAGLAFGFIFSVPATIGIVSGLVMMQAPYPESLGKAFAGLAWIIISVPPEILGLTLLGIHSSRLKSINAVLKNTEIDMGIINYPSGKELNGPVGSTLPGFSITYRF